MRSGTATGVVLALALLPSPPRAEEAAPDAATLLFDAPQLAATKPGDVLTYTYSRKSADAARFGPSFDDHIRLTIVRGSSDATRTVEAEFLSGAHGRPAGPFDNMTGNPLLSLVLEENVEAVAKELAANPRYFKTAIRAALRDKAAVVAERIDVGGRLEPGWRVTVAPFRDDPNKARMKGLDALTYEFKVADAVPGEIAEIHISAHGAAGSPLLEERVDYVAKPN